MSKDIFYESHAKCLKLDNPEYRFTIYSLSFVMAYTKLVTN